MTGFNTAVGHGKYSLTFNTDNQFYYQHIQQAARDCVDGILPPKPHSNADRIRAMSDEELAQFIDSIERGTVEMWHGFCDICDDKECWRCNLDWLKQEVNE